MNLHKIKFGRIVAVVLVVLLCFFTLKTGMSGISRETAQAVNDELATVEEATEEEATAEDEAGTEATAGAETEPETIQEEATAEDEAEKEAIAEAETEPETTKPETTAEEETKAEAIAEEEQTGEAALREEPVPLIFTGPVQAFAEPRTMYPTTGLNIRTGPGTEYEIVGRLAFNEPISYTGMTDNGWYQLAYGDKLCYVSGNYLSETKLEPAPAAPSAGSTASGGVIIIGDSRCVQMQTAVGGGGCAWICQNSMGYKWFSETAVPQADPSVGKGTKVVVCMGVNDPGNVRNYAELVNAKAAEWAARGASVYYVSVNPVWENPYVTQEQVDVFNSTMPGLLSGVTWIDTQSWMIENGYRIVDGLHYDDPTSINVFNLIMGSL